MPSPARFRPWVLALTLSAAAATGHARDPARDLLELSIEELMELTVLAPSRQAERARDAAANVIVITREDLRLRGYRELSELYDDLPGMDVSRAYGDAWFRNQWRGLRRGISIPYLLLLDGQPLNHLYFNHDKVMAALPIVQIERVEVVYGPSAVIHGANAFAGVVNVVTVSPGERPETGELRVAYGDFDRRIVDLHLNGKRNGHALSLALREDRGGLDPGSRGDLPQLSDAYYADRRLWGAFADSRYGGRFRSQHRLRGLDLRWQFGPWAFFAQALTVSTGYGLHYAADLAQNDAVWTEPSRYAGVSHRLDGTRWRGTTLLRWRDGGVADDSYFVEGYPALQPDGSTRRVVDFSYWGAENRALALSHDGELALSPRLALVGGAQMEWKNLQKAYRINFGPSVFPTALATLADYPFPPRARFDTVPDNRIRTRQWSTYVQFRSNWEGLLGTDDQHSLTLGARHDDFSTGASATTLRGGYVGRWEGWTLKLLYGEAFNEPSPRERYGGWQGSGSDPALEPETGATREANLAWQGRQTALWASLWRLDTRDDIVLLPGTAANLGRRRIAGLDLGLRWRAPGGRHDLWAYASRTFHAEEQRPDDTGSLRWGAIGDTAEGRLQAGWRWQLGRQTASTLRFRAFSERETVATNPVRRLPGYALLDLNLRHELLPEQGLTVALSITNLGNRRYAHPGLRTAGAGIAPGRFGPDGEWIGSTDFFNSLLPQPGRAWMLSLDWRR